MFCYCRSSCANNHKDAYTDLNTSHYVGKQVGIMLVYTMTADQGLRKIDDIREKILAFTVCVMTRLAQ